MSLIHLNQHELEVIQGCLLGDGHLSINGKSSCFHYGSSNEDHTRYVWSQLKGLMTNRYKDGPVRLDIYDKRTNKTYVRYEVRTKSNIVFYNLRIKWYPNGIKIVPNYLLLTNTIALLWYIGDGSMSKDSGIIKLCTDSFDTSSLIHLNKLLSPWGSWINENNNRLYIKRINSKRFLEYIGDCPVPSYNHKWNVKTLKNKTIEEFGPNDYSYQYGPIIIDFNSGEHTIYALSKKYNIPIKCIKNHFQTNKIEFETVDTKVKVEQWDLNNIYIKTWNSVSECKKYGYDPSGIIACCKGKRKTHKKYKWNYEKR